MTNEEKYLGIGVVFPFELSGGGVRVTSGRALIRSNIMGLFAFEKGYKFFDKEFGSSHRSLMDEPLSPVTIGLIRGYFEESILKYEPRIELTSVDTRLVGSTRLDVTVSYFIKSTQVTDSFTFPYYHNINN